MEKLAKEIVSSLQSDACGTKDIEKLIQSYMIEVTFRGASQEEIEQKMAKHLRRCGWTVRFRQL